MRLTWLIMFCFFALTAHGAMAQTRLDLATAILPTHRSAAEGNTISHFAVMINGSATDTLTNCRMQAPGNVAGNDEELRRNSFVYQTVDAGNNLTGSPNTPVDLPPGAVQHFVFSMDASSVFGSFGFFAKQTALFRCDNGNGQDTTYVNTSSLYYTDLKAPMDALAIAVTPSGDGILRIATAGGTEAFSLAATNIGSDGASENVTVRPSLDVQIAKSSVFDDQAYKGAFSRLADLSICETNPATGDCLAAATDSVTASLGAGVSTFSVFVTTDAETGATLLPQWLRVTVDFVPETAALGETAGRTSVALTAPGALTGTSETFANLSPGLYAIRLRPNSFSTIGGIKDGEILVFQPPSSSADDPEKSDPPQSQNGRFDKAEHYNYAGAVMAQLFLGRDSLVLTSDDRLAEIDAEEAERAARFLASIRDRTDLDKPPNGQVVTPVGARTDNGGSATLARAPSDFPGDEVMLLQQVVNQSLLQSFVLNLQQNLDIGAGFSGELRNISTGASEGTLNLGNNGITTDLTSIGCQMAITEQPLNFATNAITYLVAMTDITNLTCALTGDYVLMLYQSNLAERAFTTLDPASLYAMALLIGRTNTPTEGAGLSLAVKFDPN